jgi:toxin ParE1/3/4
MTPRYVLAPEAAQDIFEIWLYIREHSSTEVAAEVESAILDTIALLAANPGIGHFREDLTGQRVKFFRVYSYLIGYRPDTSPLQIVCVLHGRRDLEQVLKTRL